MLKYLLLALTSITAVANDDIKIKITVGDHTLNGTFYNNATAHALVSKFPLTLPMEDLYHREMCYHFPEALPANETQKMGYDVGDIMYWAPRHSFVIMYEQNGEKISNMQKVGKIDSGVSIFKNTGNINVKFEVITSKTE